MRLIIQKNYDFMSEWTAQYIADKIKKTEQISDKPFVLGLSTGSTPLGTYQRLVEMFEKGEISFQNVVSFNMDEYVNIPQDHEQSYYTYMWDNFFSKIDILPERVNMLDGNAADLKAECQAFEDKIKSYGGVDLFMGGIGADGHIAFNEPGSSLSSRTRIKTLTQDTIISNSRFFKNDVHQVPTHALTVGVGTVFDAKEVMILVSGFSKARALRHAVEEPINHMWTISILQLHQKAIIVCDEDACAELKVGTYNYFKNVEKDAIL